MNELDEWLVLELDDKITGPGKSRIWSLKLQKNPHSHIITSLSPHHTAIATDNTLKILKYRHPPCSIYGSSPLTQPPKSLI